MSRFLTTPDRVGLAVHDRLVAAGIEPDRAAFVGQQVRAALARDNRLAELHVYSVRDHSGSPHACVAREVPAGGVPLFRIDLAGLCKAARREIAAEFEVDDRLADAGTEI